jgi:hypothetical protein
VCRDPPCLPSAPYQLLQGSQLFWQVAEACAVQLQPSKAGHGLDILREVATLGGGAVGHGEAGLADGCSTTCRGSHCSWKSWRGNTANSPAVKPLTNHFATLYFNFVNHNIPPCDKNTGLRCVSPAGLSPRKARTEMVVSGDIQYPTPLTSLSRH